MSAAPELKVNAVRLQGDAYDMGVQFAQEVVIRAALQITDPMPPHDQASFFIATLASLAAHISGRVDPQAAVDLLRHMADQVSEIYGKPTPAETH